MEAGRLEILREGAPFLVGMLVPLAIALITRIPLAARFKSVVLVVVTLLVGASASFLNGEFAGGLPDALMAIIIDSSLVYTGSQLAYRIAWKPLLASRRRAAASAAAAVTQG